MKKKYFDKELILEGISQLKLPGLIILLITVLASVLPAIFNWMSYKNYVNNLSEIHVYIMEVSPILVPFFYLAPFIFCLVLFSFLNNRKGSDFYHSIPQTRICLFLSYTVSIIAWLFGIIVLTVLPASLVYAVSGLNFNPIFIPYLIFTFFAGSLLVTACMLLAMSITGTVFTNIILFGLILFLPRFITSLAIQNITNLNILWPNFGGLARVDYNIPVKFIFRYFINTNSSNDSFYTSIPAIVYSIILAIIYLAVACVLFRYRKSETAGSSAPNTALQHVYRCVVTLPFALCIPIIIISNGVQNYLPVIISLTVVSIIVYFLFELLTTKSVKKMIKSAPMLLAVVAVCAVFGATVGAVKSSILNFTPAASEIESVSISPIVVGRMDSLYGFENVKDLWYNDDSLKSVVSEALSDNVKSLKTEQYVDPNCSYYVSFHMKNGRYVQRKIYTNDDQTSEIEKWMLSNDEYLDNLLKLPPDNIISSIVVGNIPDKSDVRKLWESYKSEYSTLSKSEKKSFISNYLSTQQSQSASDFIDYIIISGVNGSDIYTYYYPIYSSMSKTVSLYFEFSNKESKDKAKSLLTKYLSEGTGLKYCQIMLFNSKDTQLNKDGSKSTLLAEFVIDSSDDSNSVKSKLTKCLSIIKNEFDKPLDPNKTYIQVYIGDKDNIYSYYQSISDENAKAIHEVNLDGSSD